MWRASCKQFAVCVGVLALLFARSASVSAQSATGNTHGTITDQSGAALPGVTVTLTSPALLVAQDAVSDAAGVYRFDQLPVNGSYSRYDLTPGDEHASACNPNVATITTHRWAGPSFGRITTISTPIIARLGMT